MDEEIKSPKEDIAKKQVLAIETANVRIKELIIESVRIGKPKEELEKEIKVIIEEIAEELKSNHVIQQQFVDGIKASTQRWYKYYTENIKTINLITLKRLAALGIEVPEINISFGTGDKFRPFVANNKKGLAIIEDYERQVMRELKKLTLDNPTASIIDKNGKVRKVNLRNQAETYVRLEANAKDINNLKDKGVKLVVTTSHADCSIRCRPFQGKIFSLDGTSGIINGKKYFPLEEAMKGKNGDGNGIISGYNCRHRAIPYKSGMEMPTEYTEAEIKRERAIDSKQRYYERNIRAKKIQERLLRAQGLQEQANKLKLRWMAQNKEYQIFSHKNGRAYYPWRTEIET